MKNDPLDGSVQRDVAKFNQMRSNGGFETSLPAIVELVLMTFAAIAGLAWFVAMFLWVPDPIPGGIWLGFGMLGVGIFGIPALFVWWLRRGGVRVMGSLIRGGI